MMVRFTLRTYLEEFLKYVLILNAILQLRSKSSRNDGLCFQIFGNGPAYLLNTIIFVYGEGDKYQRFRLWFDPTKDYHSYRFLWNPYQVV